MFLYFGVEVNAKKKSLTALEEGSASLLFHTWTLQTRDIASSNAHRTFALTLHCCVLLALLSELSMSMARRLDRPLCDLLVGQPVLLDILQVAVKVCQFAAEAILQSLDHKRGT